MSFLNKLPFYKVSELFSSPPKAEDELYRRLKTDPQFRSAQTWNGISLILYALTTVFAWIIYFSYTPNAAPDVLQVAVRDKEVNVGKLITLPTPRYTDEALRSWTNEAVNNIFNFTFLNYEEQLANARKYFTKSGFEAYKNAIEKRGLNKQLQQNKQIQNVTITGQIRMIGGNKGYFNKEDKRRYWQLKVPAMRSLTSGRTKLTNVMVEMIVVLDTDSDGRSGFFINELTITEE